MTITAYKWSIDRYHQLIEMGLLDDPLSQQLSPQSVELLRGEIIVMAPEGESHAYKYPGILNSRYGIALVFPGHQIFTTYYLKYEF
ncbi:hypothetical protein [Chamaesiphon sp.]|uniref:hypothetical protein n=1 Tax=Chamaesiphon sp. TaxID=2814140 RepID=UPI003593D853